MARRMSRAMWEKVNRARSLRDAEIAVGRKAQQRAQQITNAEGGKARITVEYGVRPGGRSRVNVVSDSPAEEYGTQKQKRIRALGRASREV